MITWIEVAVPLHLIAAIWATSFMKNNPNVAEWVDTCMLWTFILTLCSHATAIVALLCGWSP